MNTDTRERMIVHCPRCGCRVWKTRLTQSGCPTCRTLDARDTHPHPAR